MDVGSLLAGLDDGQRLAVTTTDSPLCIMAGAGSGKTRVLTRRIAYRVATDDADPRHVLALTFTRKAAGELASRLRNLGLRDLPTAGTFHAVAWSQLHTWWKGFGRTPPQLLDRKGRILGPLLGRTTRMSVPELATEIEWAKARRFLPERYPLAATQADRRTGLATSKVADLYAAYEEQKQRRGLVDFDDLLERCADALVADPGFAEAQRWRFRHLFVDEFQDVNPLQHHLLHAWLGDRTDLCVVGDPHQAIYRWNGADASFLNDFVDHHPGAGQVALLDNYRSTPEILAVAAAVLDGGTGQARRQHAHRPSGSVPTVVAYPNETEEANGVVRAVRDNHRPGGRWGRQAVLVRTNAQTAFVEQAMRRARIPYRVRGANAFLGRPEVQRALNDLVRAPGRLAPALIDLVPDLVDGAGLTDEARDQQENLAALARLCHEFLALEPDGSAREFRWWLTATVQSDDYRDAGSDAVEVVTFHVAKGLEWPVVHVAGLEDGLVPSSHARTPEAMAEERRLLYVAVTRAEEVLRCTWAAERALGSRPVARRPSPFLGHVADATFALRVATADVDHEGGMASARARLETANRPVPDDGLLIALQAWRDRVARAAAVPPEVVLANRTLAAVVARRPTSAGDLDGVEGLGPLKAAEYGSTLLSLVAEHSLG